MSRRRVSDPFLSAYKNVWEKTPSYLKEDGSTGRNLAEELFQEEEVESDRLDKHEGGGFADQQAAVAADNADTDEEIPLPGLHLKPRSEVEAFLHGVGWSRSEEDDERADVTNGDHRGDDDDDDANSGLATNDNAAIKIEVAPKKSCIKSAAASDAVDRKVRLKEVTKDADRVIAMSQMLSRHVEPSLRGDVLVEVQTIPNEDSNNDGEDANAPTQMEADGQTRSSSLRSRLINAFRRAREMQRKDETTNSGDGEQQKAAPKEESSLYQRKRKPKKLILVTNASPTTIPRNYTSSDGQEHSASNSAATSPAASPSSRSVSPQRNGMLLPAPPPSGSSPSISPHTSPGGRNRKGLQINLPDLDGEKTNKIGEKNTCAAATATPSGSSSNKTTPKNTSARGKLAVELMDLGEMLVSDVDIPQASPQSTSPKNAMPIIPSPSSRSLRSPRALKLNEIVPQNQPLARSSSLGSPRSRLASSGNISPQPPSSPSMRSPSPSSPTMVSRSSSPMQQSRSSSPQSLFPGLQFPHPPSPSQQLSPRSSSPQSFLPKNDPFSHAAIGSSSMHHPHPPTAISPASSPRSQIGSFQPIDNGKNTALKSPSAILPNLHEINVKKSISMPSPGHPRFQGWNVRQSIEGFMMGED